MTECQFPGPGINPGKMVDLNTKLWTLHIDESSTFDSNEAEIIFNSPENFKVQIAIIFTFPATNNRVEYEAILGGLKLASELEVANISIFNNSQLIVKYVPSEFKTNNERMETYMTKVKNRLEKFTSWTLTNIIKS